MSCNDTVPAWRTGGCRCHIYVRLRWRLPRDEIAHEDKRQTEREESNVVHELIRAGADVMDAKKVVIDDSFDDVEQPPPLRREAQELPTRPSDSIVMDPAPEGDRSDRQQYHCYNVKQPVGDHVEFQAPDGRHRAAGLVRKHVVPAENLVEDHAIDKSSEADTKQDARSRDRVRLAPLCLIGRSPHRHLMPSGKEPKRTTSSAMDSSTSTMGCGGRGWHPMDCPRSVLQNRRYDRSRIGCDSGQTRVHPLEFGRS